MKLKRLWSGFLNLFPSECTDCYTRMKRNDKIYMTAISGCGIGVYYRGKGICRKCCDKRLDETLGPNSFSTKSVPKV